MKWRFQRNALLLAWFAASAATSQAETLNQFLGEQIVQVPTQNRSRVAINLETTLYRPPGTGPFPVVIINHGKAKGASRLQDRSRYVWAAREFLERGYMVVLPMRQGFANSGGTYIASHCNAETNGRIHAQDVLATLAYLKTQPDADLSRVVVIGQSQGGLVTMAFGTLNYPGVRGLINFVGGLRAKSCTSWEGGLISAFAAYGRETKTPSLWFYGDNDSYWKPWLYREMHQRYVQAGGPARLVAFGKFEDDAHNLFGARRGVPVWLPEVEKFLGELKLPTRKLHKIPLTANDDAESVEDAINPVNPSIANTALKK